MHQRQRSHHAGIRETIRAPGSTAADQKDLTIRKDLIFTRSGWLAFRVTSPKGGVTGRWDFKKTAAHTSPIYVTVNGKLPKDEASATYLVARLDASLK